MRILNPEQTLQCIYSGWLGKLIGVRLGAPVEMWTSEQILEKYGSQKGYLKDYSEFAADDDTNGPTFFIRAMEDSGHYRDMTAQDVSSAWLNYPPWGKGMYWWGGYGISAEHTAYENLRNAVHAPRSGSMEMNGAELAQQIGGQIFSDAWGLVCPGDPKLAADLSEKAASVSHDGEAVYGGRFVAACIASAFTAADEHEMIEAGLGQIPSGSLYAKVFHDVKAFYEEKRGDWQSCLLMLREQYWRDKFGGGCHIIPNAGIMALALYYGKGDFDETLDICNRCGFDTDCNVGNLGAMMGVLVGLEGIHDSWRRPINDFYACSSVIGALNLQDAANFSLYLANLAVKLGFTLPADIHSLPKANFRLNGSTHGLRIVHDEEDKGAYGLYTPEFGGALKIQLSKGETRVYQRTYMRCGEFTDDRYSPAFSPTLYPGQTVTGKVKAFGKAKARIYVIDGNANLAYYGDTACLNSGEVTELSFRIPYLSGACITRAGVAFETEQDCEIIFKSLDWQGMANYTLDFEKERIEAWSFPHRPVSQLTHLKGYWNLLEKKLSGSCADLGESYTGDPEWTDGVFDCVLTPVSGGSHRFLFRVQGGARAYGAELNAHGLSLLKNNEKWETLQTVPFAWGLGEDVVLSVTLKGNSISIEANGKHLLSYSDPQALKKGQIGFGVAGGSRCLFDKVHVKPLTQED
jgi:ADP-ribosylglycohydrolase